MEKVKINSEYWTDPAIRDLTPRERMFYLYLLTNTQVEEARNGYHEYSIPALQLEEQTGYEADEIFDLTVALHEKGLVDGVESILKLTVKAYKGPENV